MNRLLKLLVIASLIIVAVQNTVGQERRVMAKELDDLKAKAYSILKQKPHRQNAHFESFDGLDLVPFDKWQRTIEFLDSETKREVSVGKFRNRYTGVIRHRIERVYKDNRKFVRFDDDPWKVDPSADGPVRGSDLETLYARSPNVVSEFMYKGKVKINNISVDRYEVTRKYIDQYRGSERSRIFKGYFLFDKKGRLLKTEYETNKLDGQYSYHYIQEFEYDPKMKIEAPVK